METQYAWIFSFLILSQVKRGDSFSMFPILTYLQGTHSTKEAIDSFFGRAI